MSSRHWYVIDTNHNYTEVWQGGELPVCAACLQITGMLLISITMTSCKYALASDSSNTSCKHLLVSYSSFIFLVCHWSLIWSWMSIFRYFCHNLRPLWIGMLLWIEMSFNITPWMSIFRYVLSSLKLSLSCMLIHHRILNVCLSVYFFPSFAASLNWYVIQHRILNIYFFGMHSMIHAICIWYVIHCTCLECV